MDYVIKKQGESRSFPEGDAFLEGASAEGDIVLHLGMPFDPDMGKTAVLVELGMECLGVHTGEYAGLEGTNALGFARYRNGEQSPSNLVELVRQPTTDDGAIAAALAMFEAAGFEVAVSTDQAGRIIDRLVRPKYNAALTFLDEGLATAGDMDLTCRLGLGYAKGPIERLEQGGLAHHFDVTKGLFEVYGTPAYAPGRRATVAKQRQSAE